MNNYVCSFCKTKANGFTNEKCDRFLVTVKSWFNDQAYHAVGVALNAVDNAILKNVTGNVSKQITVTNHPLPRTLMQKSDDLDEYVNV
jgi:hypothetical protein